MNHRIVLQDMPHRIKGFVSVDEEDFCTIYLNSRLSAETLRETYDHEISHIRSRDIYSTRSVQEIESERHKK